MATSDELKQEKIGQLVMEILRLDSPSEWQVEKIVERAVDFGYCLAVMEAGVKSN